MDKKLKLAVIGNPISHSKSPEIHQDFADQFDTKIEFSKYEVTPDALKEWLDSFFLDGGKGVSITLPLKESALNYADEISDRAKLASACNVIYAKGDKLFADCTDGFGLIKDLEENLTVFLEGKKILILGAGGAARGIIPSILEKNPKKLKIANRTKSKALLLKDDLESKVKPNENKIILALKIPLQLLVAQMEDYLLLLPCYKIQIYLKLLFHKLEFWICCVLANLQLAGHGKAIMDQ